MDSEPPFLDRFPEDGPLPSMGTTSICTPMHPLLIYLFDLERKGIKLGLGPTRELLKRCGNPQRSFPIVQIAGTNGKGSTAAITARILQEHGKRVGLFTSPHLLRFNERIRVDGFPVDDGYLVQWIERFRDALEDIPATFFEAITALALSYFQHQGVDVAVLETGLGGRLDATTATDPSWCALTPIALDHTDMLGETIEAIAREKAGILRQGVPCFSVQQPAEVEATIRSEAERLGSKITFIHNEIAVPRPRKLTGVHQHDNARLAWTLAQAALAKDFNRQKAAKAVEDVFWPGRYQRLSHRPEVIYDVTHNPHGVAAFLATVAEEYIPGHSRLVLALQQGKKIAQILEMLCSRFDDVFLTQTNTRHYLPAADLARQLPDGNLHLHIEPEPAAAIREAVTGAGEKDFVAIVGSHYLGPAVAEVFKISFDNLI